METITVNTKKTKVMIFRKGGILPRNLKFYYNDEELEIVNTFSYLGIIFSPGSSFSNTQITGRFPLPLGAWDGLRYFIVALPEPSI